MSVIRLPKHNLPPLRDPPPSRRRSSNDVPPPRMPPPSWSPHHPPTEDQLNEYRRLRMECAERLHREKLSEGLPRARILANPRWAELAIACLLSFAVGVVLAAMALGAC